MSKPDFTFTAENGTSFTTDRDGFIKGEVRTDPSELISRDLEGALDMFSEELTGSTLLMDVDYKAVRVEDGAIVFEVSGDPASIIESLGLDEDDASPAP